MCKFTSNLLQMMTHGFIFTSISLTNFRFFCQDDVVKGITSLVGSREEFDIYFGLFPPSPLKKKG